MNKSQLIDTLAARFEGNRKAAAHALDSVLDTITREVAKGEKVAITGFGSFEKRVRGARWVRNPSTGVRMQSSERAVPAFRPGAQLRDVVSGAKKLPALTLAAVEAAAPAVAQPAIAQAAAVARRATGGGSSTTSPSTTSSAKKSPARSSEEVDGEEVDGEEVDGEEVAGQEVDAQVRVRRGQQVVREEVHRQEDPGEEVDGEEVDRQEVRQLRRAAPAPAAPGATR